METVNVGDRYSRQTPYDHLRVLPTASVVELRTAFAEHEEQIRNDRNLDTTERARRQQELRQHYENVSSGGKRVRVDFFLLDPRVGSRQCLTIAESVPKPDTQLEGVIKPRKIRITHEALFDELEKHFQNPPRVEGLHPRPLQESATATLPEPLAIVFDC